MQIAAHHDDSTDNTDAPTTGDDTDRREDPDPHTGRDPHRLQPADHCRAPSCWSTTDLQLVDPETNAGAITLCRRCRKAYWGTSS